MFSQAIEQLLSSHDFVKRNPDLDPNLLEDQQQYFQRRFGPHVLGSLHGEELLMFWHGTGNKDGLLYELEAGVMTQNHGSVWGGTALKYKVYRAADGDWKIKGPGNMPVRCSVDTAIDLTERLASDLMIGCEWAERIRANPSGSAWDDFNDYMYGMESPLQDDGYNKPTLSLGWAHKYLALNFPEVISFHHRTKQLAAHLVLLGIQPAGGRYSNDQQWYQFRTEIGDFQWTHPVVLMQAAYNEQIGFGYGPDYWRIGTTEEGHSVWSEMSDGSFISIGWNQMGDLRYQLEGVSGKAATDRLKNILFSIYPDRSPIAIGKWAGEIRAFYQDIKPNDRVVAMEGQTILGVGKVSGEYQFIPEGTFHHRRDVEWHWRAELHGSQVWSNYPGARRTVYSFRERWMDALKIETFINEYEPEMRPIVLPKPVVPPPPAPIAPLDNHCKRVQAILARKGQVILHGPPGTGKTYLARRAAREILAREIHQVDWANLNESQQGEVDEHISFCTFHPAYSYEEFVEGFHPELAEQGTTFIRRNGLFRNVCEEAGKVTHHVVLIIDEINRANISVVLGELLTLLEMDKREELDVRLPLSRDNFSVPRNLWIIGTMNTADRSIALLDAALRRRFGFIELMPEPESLDAKVEGIHLGMLLRELNERVRNNVPHNARSLQIGHSYFLEGGKPLNTRDALVAVLRDDVLPLLAEYCFEDFDSLASILGEDIVDLPGQRFLPSIMDNDTSLMDGIRRLISEVTTEEAVQAGSVDDEGDDLPNKEGDEPTDEV